MSLTFAHLAYDWLLYVVDTWTPTWLDQQLGFGMLKSGALAALPPLGMCAISLVAGAVATRLIETKSMSVTNVRRICQGVGLIVPGICVVAAGLVGNSNRSVAVGLILVGPALGGEGFDESCLYATDYDRRYRPQTADSPWSSWRHGDD